jgi:transposase
VLGARSAAVLRLADIAANARRGKNAAAISPIALEAVKHIDALFDIERGINGQSSEERLRVRREQSAPLVAALEARLRGQRSRLSRSSSVAEPTESWWVAAPCSVSRRVGVAG